MLLEFRNWFYDTDESGGAAKEVETTVEKQEDTPYKVFQTEEEYQKELKSAQSKAKNELLKRIGINSVDEGTENITKAQQLEQDLQKALSAMSKLEEENVLVKHGIQDEFKEEALLLARAKGDMDLNEALSSVVKKFPNFQGKQEKRVEKVGGERKEAKPQDDSQRIIDELNRKYRTNIKI